MASEVLNTISKDWYERCRIASKEKYELDMQSDLVYAKRQSKLEGKLEEKQEVINLLKSGKSLEQIIKEYEGQ